MFATLYISLCSLSSQSSSHSHRLRLQHSWPVWQCGLAVGDKEHVKPSVQAVVLLLDTHLQTQGVSRAQQALDVGNHAAGCNNVSI
jgi:hypothetical protein